MFNKGRYAYDRVQLEEVSSEEEYRPASPVVRSPPHPFPERKKHAVRTQQPPMRCCCLNELCVKCLYLFVVGLVMLAGFLIILNIIKHNSSSGGNSNVGSDRKPVIQVINNTNSGISSDFPVCSKLEVHQVWVQNFPQLLTETAVRLVDVNKDGILDAILGFATGAGSPFADPDLVCRIYFDGQVPCFGGVLALDGITGNEIWRHWSEQEVFALNCNADITGDGVSDCVCSGRMGMFELISGSDGVRLWVFDNHASKVSISNFYTAQFLHDIDGDDVQDILTVHGGDPLRKPGANVSYAGRVMLFSGATGQLITWSKVPDGMESYYSPQVYYNSQGEEVVLFGTGGETHGGSLWIIKLQDVINGKIQEARCLYKDVYKGVMTPPVLLDLTGDSVLDIVIATFNSTVLAINGDNYERIWNFSMPMSETYATPAPGFFNDDDVPDVLVIFNHGPTFPVYYYSEVTVLDGKTGEPLIQPFIRHSGSIQSSPLTVSIEGTGQDMFLYFASDCLNHEGKSTKFSFTKSTFQSSKSRADFCKVRFNTSSYSRLYAMSYSTGSPGSIVYNSLSHTSDEYRHSINTSVLADNFLKKFPGTAEYVINRRRQQHQKKPTNYKETNNHGHKGHQFVDYVPTTTSHLRPTESRVGDASSLSKTEETRHMFVTYPSDDSYLGNFLYNKEHASDGLDSYNEIKTVTQKAKELDKHTQSQESNKQSKHSKKHKLLQLVEEMMQDSGVSNPGIENVITPDNLNGNNYGNRGKRHAGPHDSGGLQRLIATGTLVPRLHRGSDGIDLIFPVYWFYPSETEILTEDEQNCVDRKMEVEGDRMNIDSKYYGMDHDAYEQVVEDECKGNNSDSLKKAEEILLTDPLKMYPFNLHMGEMTVYRLHLTCACAQPPCARVLPFRQQAWPSYLGARANSLYVHRKWGKKI